MRKLHWVGGALAVRTVGLIIPLFAMGCGECIYSVDMVNHGQNGVILLQVGQETGVVRKPYKVHRPDGTTRWETYVASPGLEDVAFVIAMDPSIPSEFRDPTSAFGRFKGYEDKLPDQVEIVWQLAELKECDDVMGVGDLNPSARKWLVSQNLDPSRYIYKAGCTWRPLPGKIFHKQLDMQAIRDSEAYREATRLRLDTPFNRHILRVELVFAEDQLTVNTDQYTVNWFK